MVTQGLAVIPRIEALNELTRLSQDAGMYDAHKPKRERLHLQNKATHWINDGELQFVWCVVTESGKRLTRWLTHEGADSQMFKIIAKMEREQ